MLVYSVIEQIDYEGGSLLGVFGSREQAEQFVRSYDGFQRQYPGYSYGVVESELGQEIDFFGMVEWVE